MFFLPVCVSTGGGSLLEVNVRKTLGCLQPSASQSKWLLHQRYSLAPSHRPPHQSSQPELLSPHFLSLSAKSGCRVTSNMKRPQFPFNVACLERRAGRLAAMLREENICTTPASPSSQVAPPPLKCERWGRTGACRVAERKAGRTDERRKGRQEAS